MKHLLKRSTRPKRRRTAGCLGNILSLIVVYFLAFFLFRGPITDHPLKIAHRGGTVGVPENTLASFRSAAALGMDELEFDVQRTADGMLIVFHDETVDRTTDGTGSVADMSFDEIRALDAGEGEQVPTFDEVIQFAGENGLGIFPEAKSPDLYPGIEVDMMVVLEKNGYVEETVIQSFDSAALEAIESHNSDFYTCFLTGQWEFNFSMPAFGADAICPMAEMVVLYPWMIRQAHAEGLEIYPWFGKYENPALMRVMLFLGVDGLMVDDTAALAGVVE